MTNFSSLEVLQAKLRRCRTCPKMIRPVVHGPPVMAQVYLVGQAPGDKEGPLGRPFAWTAGKTLFRWFRQALKVDEQTVRDHVYFAAVARCFPGKAPKGGDRKPDEHEVENCSRWMKSEVTLLRPTLVLPVGTMAIERVLGHSGQLKDVVGRLHQTMFFGQQVDVIPLPHPSGASTWHITEPGKSLLISALQIMAAHPTLISLFLPHQISE